MQKYTHIQIHKYRETILGKKWVSLDIKIPKYWSENIPSPVFTTTQGNPVLT